MQREEMAKILAGHEDELRKKFGVKKMALFDAYVRGVPGQEGDVDVMAEYENNDVSLFDVIRLEDYLEEILGEEINMTPRNSVVPRPQDLIRGEPLYVLR